MPKVDLTSTLAGFVTSYNTTDSNFSVLDSSFKLLDSAFRAAGFGDSTSPNITETDSTGAIIPLATTNQSITGAINEVDSNVGNLASLTTTTKSSLVDALNELDSALNDLDLAVGGTAASNLKFGDSKEIVFGNDSDARIFTDGSDLFLDLQSGINNFIIRDGTTVKYTFDDNGDFTAEGNVTAYSDERLKENIETIEDALSIVDSLRGVYYTKDGRKETGVIAQEVKEVFPEVVRDNGEYMSVAYGNMIGVMIEAIKELKAEVDRLKNGSSD